MNKEFFRADLSTGEGQPFLYSHGLGSPELADDLRQPLEGAGFSVSALLRNDAEILATKNPQELLVEETLDISKQLYQSTGKKIILGGNSLGSYIVMATAAAASEHISGIVCTDTFFTPNHGFRDMRKNMSETLELILEAQDRGKKVLPPWNLLPEKYNNAQTGNFPVSLIGDRWIELPVDVYKKFTPIDTIPGVGDISVPIHLVWGEKDSYILSDRKPHTLLGNRKNITYHEIPEAEHNDWKDSNQAKQSIFSFLKTLQKYE